MKNLNIDMRVVKGAFKLFKETDEMYSAMLTTIYNIEVNILVNCRRVKIRNKRCLQYSKGIYLEFILRTAFPRHYGNIELNSSGSYREFFKSFNTTLTNKYELRQKSQSQFKVVDEDDKLYRLEQRVLKD